VKKTYQVLNNEWLFAVSIFSLWMLGKVYVFGAHSALSSIN